MCACVNVAYFTFLSSYRYKLYFYRTDTYDTRQSTSHHGVRSFLRCGRDYVEIGQHGEGISETVRKEGHEDTDVGAGCSRKD